MKTDILLNNETNSIPLSNVVKAEARKLIDTQVAKTIIITTFVLTLAMFIISIFRFKNAGSWTDPFTSISSPSSTILPIIFILLICEEWTRGTALVTYTFVPQRNKVILAKFTILLVTFLGTILTLYALSAISSIIASGIYSYSFSWSVDIYSIVKQVLPLLINMLLGFSMAMVAQEITIALGLYFIIPPITVLATQLPVIGSYLKWISLEHSSSIFIAGATGVSGMEYVCSILTWIVVPSIIGIFINLKRDLN